MISNLLIPPFRDEPEQEPEPFIFTIPPGGSNPPDEPF